MEQVKTVYVTSMPTGTRFKDEYGHWWVKQEDGEWEPEDDSE